jgi:hypothetical protein
MFALILNNEVVQVSEFIFPVAGMEWIECDETVKNQWYYVDGVFKETLETEAEIAARRLAELKVAKLSELKFNYSYAQLIQLQNGHTFQIPLMGEAFNLVQTQYLSSQARGFAPLRWPDVDGVMRILRDIPASTWQSFYMVAKVTSEENYFMQQDLILEIAACTEEASLNLIDLNPFPAIQTITLDLPA